MTTNLRNAGAHQAAADDGHVFDVHLRGHAAGQGTSGEHCWLFVGAHEKKYKQTLVGRHLEYTLSDRGE